MQFYIYSKFICNIQKHVYNVSNKIDIFINIKLTNYGKEINAGRIYLESKRKVSKFRLY